MKVPFDRETCQFVILLFRLKIHLGCVAFSGIMRTWRQGFLHAACVRITRINSLRHPFLSQFHALSGKTHIIRKNPYLHSVGRQGIIMAISDLRGKRHGKEKRTICVTQRNALG